MELAEGRGKKFRSRCDCECHFVLLIVLARGCYVRRGFRCESFE